MILGRYTLQALTHGTGRKLIVAHDSKLPGFFAILDFAHQDDRVGGAGRTPEEALLALEVELKLEAGV